MNHLLSAAIIIAGLAIPQTSNAQFSEEIKTQAFEHLDLGITAGTTGIGFDLATPICNFAQVRAGFSYMPKIKPTMHFGVQVGDDPATSQSKFDKMSGLLEKFTGNEIDSQIDMKGEPTLYNFNLMVDFFPLKNKNWHFTAGFYYGPSSVAKSYNKTEDMSSLVAVCMYNQMYEFFTEGKYWDEPIYGEDMYVDPQLGMTFEEKFRNYGRMGIHLGEYAKNIYNNDGELIHKEGEPYVMVPDANNMVKAKYKVNSFKPYLGFGYGGKLFKSTNKYRISFDCGALFWGGTPEIETHDGTDLASEVRNIRGKVGDYVDVAKALKVYPVINLRISKTLF